MKAPSFYSTILLAIACSVAGLSCFLVLQEPEEDRDVSKRPSVSPGDSQRYLSDETSFDIAWKNSAFDQITDRPLFSITRRPVPPREHEPEISAIIPVAPPAPPPAPPALSLIGIATDPDRRVALLRSAQTGLVVVLGEGQGFDGWTLHQVENDRVIFRIGSSETVITFTEPQAKKGGVGMRSTAAQIPWSAVNR